MASDAGGRGEQLSSLALRCAERLSLPFRDFYRELVAPVLYEGRTLPKVKGLPVSGAIDGTLEAAGIWVRAMNRLLIRTDLQRTTMLAWRQTLAPRGLVRTYRAWCPACLHDFAESGETVYEPLVWRVVEVVVCPVHTVWLETECPHCGRGKQPSFAAFTRVGCCRRCGKWLGRAVAKLTRASNSEFDVFSARTIESALALSNVEGSAELVTSDVAVRAIRDVFYEGSSAQMGRALGVLPSQIVHFAAGTFPAPLHLFVRACYATGATTKQIFQTNDFSDVARVRDGCEFEIRRSVPKRVQMSNALVKKLTEALAGDGSTSVMDIADSLNITSTTVWRRERELASRLALFHAGYAAQKMQRLKDQYQCEVIAFVKACQAQRISPGRRLIDESCGGIGRFSREWKWSVIKQAKAAIFGVGRDLAQEASESSPEETT